MVHASTLFSTVRFNIDILMHLAETRLRNGQLHPGAICDGCFQQIYGVIHLCRVCPDYCLCSECKDSDVHKEHDMIDPYGTRGMYRGINFLRQPGLIPVQGETAWQFYEFKLSLDTSWIVHCICTTSKYVIFACSHVMVVQWNVLLWLYSKTGLLDDCYMYLTCYDVNQVQNHFMLVQFQLEIFHCQDI